MPYLLEDLVVDRVDLVDEGANSAAFIELYKRKERDATMDIKEILSKMKPEHSSVIQAELDKLSGDVMKAKEDLATVTTERDTATQDLEKAKEDLKAANEDKEKAESELETLKASMPDECDCDGEADENGMCKVCDKTKKKAAFDEEETLKSMPAAARAVFIKMRTQKEAAEEEVRKAKDAEKQAEAVAKAAELKALPIETEKLVGVLKSCSADMIDVLTTINAAIEGTVLDEVGKSNAGSKGADAWSKIEAKADEIAKRDSVTKQKAVSIAIKENPELYKEYLQGGAN
jgi:predicted  nucleic acid-binding Zn-ribbon protein